MYSNTLYSHCKAFCYIYLNYFHSVAKHNKSRQHRLRLDASRGCALRYKLSIVPVNFSAVRANNSPSLHFFTAMHALFFFLFGHISHLINIVYNKSILRTRYGSRPVVVSCSAPQISALRRHRRSLHRSLQILTGHRLAIRFIDYQPNHISNRGQCDCIQIFERVFHFEKYFRPIFQVIIH